jgi:flagellar biosynthesis/type III secretory pathway chaperone
MDDQLNSGSWESDLAALLAELSAVQSDLLQTLEEKRHLLLAPDLEALAAMQERESQLIARLQACHERRLALLARAAGEGRPASSLTGLAATLPAAERSQLTPQLNEASARIRLLQHHSLTNWVIIQRTLIHLSRILEIIATCGRTVPTYSVPTYGKGDSARSGGNLVDRAA